MMVHWIKNNSPVPVRGQRNNCSK